MDEIISELNQLDMDYEEEALNVVGNEDIEDIEDVVDFKAKYNTDSGEDILIYNLSVNGVFDDCSDTQVYFPRVFAEIVGI
ncbi:MAG: hypothetical protein AMJ43_02795 [Coxiella sp. DG_40]|nr:MAG: hypothetical protein AMJ43_02795 [Coxiella sp. DG_40]